MFFATDTVRLYTLDLATSTVAPVLTTSGAVVVSIPPSTAIGRYATDLRSMTQGRGYFTVEFDHCEEVPDHIAQEVIARAREEEK